MALYALHLAQGNTVLSITIKSGTMEGYLRAAATLSTNARLMDPRLNIYGKTADPIKKVLREQKRWEDMPHRRNPVTTPMILHMCAVAKNADQDSAQAAIYDWNVLGRVYGFRCSEWAQNDEDRKHFPKLNIDGTPIAFIFGDFTFFGPNESHLDQPFNRDLRTQDVETATCTWRYQKNGDNGQSIPMTRDHKNPDLCPVLAALRIRARARRLNKSRHDTIAKFKSDTGKTRYITNSLISAHLQSAAKKIYNITKREILQLWSPHSIRVGACVLLDEAGKDGKFIQLRLRWRSIAFMDYLRNTLTLAKHHIQGISAETNN